MPYTPRDWNAGAAPGIDATHLDEMEAGIDLAVGHAEGDNDPHALDDLSDVNAPSPADGNALLWDSTPGEWVPGSPAVVAHVLNSGIHTVSGLTTDHVLKATGASSFAFGQLAHSALSGLTSGDPHTQYLLKAGGTMTGALITISGTSTAPAVGVGEAGSGLYLIATGRPRLTGAGEMGTYRRSSTAADFVHAFVSDHGTSDRTHAAVTAEGSFIGSRFNGAGSVFKSVTSKGTATNPVFALPSDGGMYEGAGGETILVDDQQNICGVFTRLENSIRNNNGQEFLLYGALTTSSTVTWRADTSGAGNRSYRVPTSKGSLKEAWEPLSNPAGLIHQLVQGAEFGQYRWRADSGVFISPNSPLQRGVKDLGMSAEWAATVHPLLAEYDDEGAPGDISERRLLILALAAVSQLADAVRPTLATSNGQPLPRGTIAAIGPVSAGKRSPDLMAYQHVRPALATDHPAVVVGVVDDESIKPAVVTLGPTLCLVTPDVEAGSLVWVGSVAGRLSVATDGWYVLERVDADTAMVLISGFRPARSTG